MMTDKIKTIKAIIFALDHCPHVDKGSKNEILIKRTQNYKTLNKNSDETERMFAIEGKDVYESGRQWSCGTLAKAFCYVNSNLKKILGKLKEHEPFKEDIKQLENDIGPLENIKPFDEVRIMISVHPEHFIDAMHGHTLPCVQMEDGKWHAIEPNTQNTLEEYKQYPVIQDEIKIGNQIHHIYQGMDKPYEIMAFMSYEDYLKQGFRGFLKVASKMDVTSQMICTSIETLFKSMTISKKPGQIYEFCRVMQKQNIKLPIKIMHFKDDKYNFDVMAIKLNKDMYYFRPYDYLVLKKFRIEKNKAITDSHQWNIVGTILTPEEYIKVYENHLKSKTSIGIKR